MAKARSVISALTAALSERGVPAHQANLAAQMGMATLSHAVAAWFHDDSSDLGEHIVDAFHEVRKTVLVFYVVIQHKLYRDVGNRPSVTSAIPFCTSFNY